MGSTAMKNSVKITRALFLAVILAGCAGAIGNAQEAAPASNQAQSEPQVTPAGPGRQLVHESREAAGQEKDEMEEFKQSASVRLISRITGLDLQRSYWLSVITNFAVILCLVVWAGRKYLPGIFRDRTAAIQRAMQDAQKASEEARRKLADIESRLQRLDVEIGMMRNAAEKEGVAEEARIQAAAEEDAKKIVASAEQEIAAAAKAARRLLTAHAADLAVGLAQKQIHVDDATDQNLVRNFSAQLSAASSEGLSPDSGKDRN
jgi:F-type H+-transporting ATPase subunit b